MNLLSSLKSFVAIVDYHSFSAAATKTHASPSKLSKEITWLENKLKTRLFVRSTRLLVLTESGKALYQKALRILRELDDLTTITNANADDLEGLIRIYISATPAIPYITELSLKFLKKYPKITVDIVVGSELASMAQGQLDLVISFENVKFPNLTCEKLFVTRRGVYASPAYLKSHGPIKTIDDLMHHNCLINTLYGLQNKWILGDQIIHVMGKFQSNNAAVLKQAAVASVGLIWVPSFSVKDEIQKGLLINVLEQYTSPNINVYYSHLSYVESSQKVKLLIDFYKAQGERDGITLAI